MWVHLNWQTDIAVHRVHQWVEESIDFPKVACMPPFSTVKATQQKGNPHLTSSLVYLCLITEVCGVFQQCSY